MGSNVSFSSNTIKCNYHCPICRESGKTPNMAGQFFLINSTQCQCNACHTIFDKNLFYAKSVDPTNAHIKWSITKTISEINNSIPKNT